MEYLKRVVRNGAALKKDKANDQYLGVYWPLTDQVTVTDDANSGGATLAAAKRSKGEFIGSEVPLPRLPAHWLREAEFRGSDAAVVSFWAGRCCGGNPTCHTGCVATGGAMGTGDRPGPGRLARAAALVVASAILAVQAGTARAQVHEGPHGQAPEASRSARDLEPLDLLRSPSGALMLRMLSMGSGTALQPESTPHTMAGGMAGPWMWQAGGDLLLSSNGATGRRAYFEPVVGNWQMLLGSGVVGRGILDLVVMTSLDPATQPNGGTPELFQTGETFQGRPLVDRQHPHDALMELSARYGYWLARGLSLFVYGGPAAEPALGPVAFMHRASAGAPGLAPLGHHWQDSTHIAFGVITAGFQWGALQAEVSAFNGREPDEARWDLELRPLDSVSARVTIVPTGDLVLQASRGVLMAPEALEPGNVVRTTASLQHNLALGRGANLASALIWGQNLRDRPSNSYLGESSLQLERNRLYGRAEYVEKEGLLPGQGEDLLPVTALTLGMARRLSLGPLDLELGADATLPLALPAGLRDAYGPGALSYRFYLRTALAGRARP